MEKSLAMEMAMVAALENIEGLKDRVCPVIDIHKSTGPLLVYDPQRESQERQLDGVAGLMMAQIQLHVLHNTYMKMRLLCESVKAAVQRLEGAKEPPLIVEAVDVEQTSPDLFEDKAELFRRTYTVTFQYQIKED